MTETELLIHETTINLLKMKKDYMNNKSKHNPNKIRTLNNAVELLDQLKEIISVMSNISDK